MTKACLLRLLARLPLLPALAALAWPLTAPAALAQDRIPPLFEDPRTNGGFARELSKHAAEPDFIRGMAAYHLGRPTAAASVRLIPSETAARAGRRRVWRLSRL